MAAHKNEVRCGFVNCQRRRSRRIASSIFIAYFCCRCCCCFCSLSAAVTQPRLNVSQNSCCCCCWLLQMRSLNCLPRSHNVSYVQRLQQQLKPCWASFSLSPSLALSLCYYKHLLVHPLLGNLILAHSGNLVPRGLPLPIIVIVIVKLLKPQTKRLKGLSLTRVYIWHNWVYIYLYNIYKDYILGRDNA